MSSATLETVLSEIRVLRKEVEQVAQRSDALQQSLDQRVDALQNGINQRFGAFHQEMNARFNSLNLELDARFVTVSRGFSELKTEVRAAREDIHFIRKQVAGNTEAIAELRATQSTLDPSTKNTPSA